jgi:hypothetical protein
MDWGFNAPGVILWWAHVGDNHWHIVRELKFQHESVETVAKRWKAMMKELGLKKVSYVAADPSMWAKTGQNVTKRNPSGQSIAETLQGYGLPMLKGDNDRKNGWQRCHELLRNAPDGTPWLTVDKTCIYGLRSLPAQVSDKKDPDDIDTGGDDHWVDAWRYGAMSRFVAGKSAPKSSPPKPGTFGYYKQLGQETVTGLLSRRSA